MKKLMQSRSGFYRTIEVLVAIVLTFTFVVYFIPYFSVTEIPQKGDLDPNILPRLQQDTSFRNCVIAQDESCIETILDDIMPLRLGFDTSISNDPGYEKQSLPAKDIYTETLFLSSNMTVYSPQIVKIYYWRK